eukprot:Hpha_TRINITY_DN5025_c0_g1::TRINITY_DN5025_c0_g1_i1::g.93947::m.93947
MSAVPQCSIQLERPGGVFWAGERVCGVLQLKTNAPFTCRGMGVLLEGGALVKWTEAVGAPGRHTIVQTRSTIYVRAYQTLLGAHRTNVVKLMGAGRGTALSMAPGEGEATIPVKEPLAELDLHVCVLGYSPTRDLLGEAVVGVGGIVGGGEVCCPLVLRGSPKGDLCLEVEQETTGALRVRVLRATGLQSFRLWHTGVFVEFYTRRREAGGPPARPPEPCKIAAGVVSFPFELSLPRRLPPSMAGGRSRSFQYGIEYTLSVHVDTDWRFDPRKLRLITVLSTDFPPPRSLLPATWNPVPNQKIYDWDCCCFKCGERGEANLVLSVDRRYLVPSDNFQALILAQNLTDVICVVKLLLVQKCCCPHRIKLREIQLYEKGLSPGEAWDSGPLRFVVPPCPATYQGGIRNGGTRDTSGGMRREGAEPLTWGYTLKAKLEFPGGCMGTPGPKCGLPVFVGKVPVDLVRALHPAPDPPDEDETPPSPRSPCLPEQAWEPPPPTVPGPYSPPGEPRRTRSCTEVLSPEDAFPVIVGKIPMAATQCEPEPAPPPPPSWALCGEDEPPPKGIAMGALDTPKALVAIAEAHPGTPLVTEDTSGAAEAPPVPGASWLSFLMS